ncbi:MAG: hypothetical protein NUW24_16080 [Anaerolineae bacterium]|nr:hypothetical protein [Anaerolineae bacterium]MDH7474988.1 hypothetical protein [Anaerolineae bacterium]
MKDSAKHAIVIAALVVALAYCGCTFFTTKTVAELSDLTLCRGWDAQGDPIVLSDPISPNETRICICGQLETNQDIMMQVFWSRERSILLTDRRVFSDGPFLSCIESDEGFEPGDYGVSVIRAKTVMGLVEFSVGEKGMVQNR